MDHFYKNIPEMIYREVKSIKDKKPIASGFKTISELAAITGIDRAWFSRLLNQETKNLAYNDVVEAAVALNLLGQEEGESSEMLKRIRDLQKQIEEQKKQIEEQETRIREYRETSAILRNHIRLLEHAPPMGGTGVGDKN